MNINTVDLNLFLVFEAIHSTRSVTLAGEKVCMTQSAVSNALKRLRERFDDPLFVRTPQGMVPTPLASQLIGPISEGLEKFNRVLNQVERFEPKISSRVFRIAINDIGQLVIIPPLIAMARRQAPFVKFETTGASEEEARQMLIEGRVDLALGSWAPMGAGFHDYTLFDETFVALMSTSYPIKSESLSAEQYLAAEHLAYRPSGASDEALQHTLANENLLAQRNVVLTAAHSLGLSAVLSSSNLILSVPYRLAQAMMQARSDLRIARLPFQVGPFPVRQQWHDRNDADSANRWLRQILFDVFQEKRVPDIEVQLA